ncbi:DHA2 family efflux MFS transporter permease subunit [Cohnella thailandensis]|uniref:DHA2 family efflux MFS transporter permease subunit n=1 Tax=Cohnella thailandensis TaxID=557557 RepID=A0A841T1T7_9BACL|nr:DHA2 family efflux MFS transporter permease subunit [Cohnella thailandensis]MBB6636816.1 DHA2 family efflux MFS transporter permease subunit [Cohnella thailandensis]MBP1973307.1 EmrB/QacA subfamily drug resistance transporter [Cohnella thailandensis]
MAENEVQSKVRFWPVMFAIFFGSFLSVLGISTINLALPFLIEDFGSDLNTIQWVLTGFMLSLGVIAPLTGYLGDRFGFKKLYLYSMVGFVGFSLLCALAWNSSSLIAFRILQGAFSGLVLPATMTIIFQVIPRERQPFAVSIWGLSAMLAPAFGPTLSGWLIQNFSWKWLFYINVPIGLIAIVFIQAMIPDYRVGKRKPLDVAGLITVVTSSASILLALSQGRQWGWMSWNTLGLFVLGVAALILFIRRELSAEHPLLNLRVFANARFSFSLVSATIIMISLYSGTLLIPLFLQNVQNVSALDTGVIMLPASLIMALGMPIAGKLYERIGPLWMTVGGLAFILVGSFELSRLDTGVSHAYIIFWMTIRNIGVSFAASATGTAGMEEIPRVQSGDASSVTNWVRNVGGSFAIALFTSLLISNASSHGQSLAASGHDQATAPLLAYTMSVNDVFLVATLIAAAALPFGLLVRKKRRQQANVSTSPGAAEEQLA